VSKAEALAALTIAVMKSMDEDMEKDDFMATLKRAYEDPDRVAGDPDTQAETVRLAATVAHENEIALDSLLETAADVWEQTELERLE
jgi:hypothetical protein